MDALIEQAAKTLAESRYAIALTGAGMSTESGIPDYRGPDGVWTKNPDAERQAYLAYDKFKSDPKKYWEERMSPDNTFWRAFAERFKEITPNPGHLALAELEKMGVLKCIITQNVDGLHGRAGNSTVYEYHGGLEKLRCPRCNTRYQREHFDLEGMYRDGRLPPLCERCGAAVKEDGVFFGEPIPRDVMDMSEEEAQRCDVMLICGTSAVVTPFAYLPRITRYRKSATGAAGSGPGTGAATIIEVNAEPTPLTAEGISDFLIRGKTGEVLPRIAEEVKQLRR